MSTLDAVNPDFRDLLEGLITAEVEFLVVGAYALALHGVPRTTGDIDIWVRPTLENARRLVAALVSFGAPLEASRISADDFCKPGLVYQIGLPPRRIDILTNLSGLTFEEAWLEKATTTLGSSRVYFIGRGLFIKNKLATGRAKDLADVERIKG
jgi:hypothetical protein